MDFVETQRKDKLLVVDDDEDVGDCYVMMLSDKGGFDVDYSPNGLVVNNIKITDYSQYFGIVMDYQLVGCLGTSVAKWIKEQGYKGKIVLNTGSFLCDIEVTSAIDAAFTKPGDGTDIIAFFKTGA